MSLHGFLTMAQKEASRSLHRYQVGCVIVSGGRVISKGYNSVAHKSKGKRFAKWDCSICAERHAASKVKDKSALKGATIYVSRWNSFGPAMACPCSHCMELIEYLGIKKIVFSRNEFPFYGVVKL